LALTYVATGQFEKAIEESREAVRLNPIESHTYLHLARGFRGLNRFDEAKAVIQQAQALKLNSFYFRRELYGIAFAQNDTAEMRRQLDLMVENDGEREALPGRARTAAFAGRWREAQAFYHRLAELVGQRNLPNATQREALFGFCQPSGEAAAHAVALSQIASPARIVFVPILADGSLCGEVSEAQKLADELARRYPKAYRVNGISLPVIRAAIELRRNQPERAIEVLQPATLYEGGASFWPNYLRGQAYLRLRRGNEAAAEFQKILDHRGWDPLSSFYPLAHLGLARALRLAGDEAGSRKAYQNLLALWKDADSDLPIQIEAKKEYEKLK
jgi:tetratricopeptide (TPR) repeat protein